MAQILVIADHQDGQLKKSTLQTLSLARSLAEQTGGGLDLALIGAGASDAAPALTGYGAETIYTVEGEGWEHYLAQPWTDAVAGLVQQAGAKYVVGGGGTMGKDLLPRVACRMGWGMAADATAVVSQDGGLAFRRPMFAGNLNAWVRVHTDGAVVSVRGSDVEAAEEAGGESPVQAVEIQRGQYGVRFVDFQGTGSERPDLGEAEVVVSGGRGLKDGDNFFEVMEPLADVLGAAIGASRAAVDSGFCPNDYQVGQTGKAVAPKLYIAVGISGAIQHLAGMKNSKWIAAINKDEEAPIFQIADYGLVADAFEAVPEVVEKIREKRQSG